MKPVYLDYAATAPLLPVVRDKMCEVLELQTQGILGNASALHDPGHRAHELIEEARAEVARLINADPAEIIFVSGGSEANNAVMESFRGKRVAVSALEHPSVLEAAKVRAGSLEVLPVDLQGVVNFTTLSVADLVSVMLANNELGTIEPITEIVEAARAQNPQVRVHTDATQAVGKIKVDVQELGADYLTLSAHKIGGPIGVGALWVRRGAPYQRLVYGGHQESGRRAGTSNVAAIAGFGAAARQARETRAWEQYATKVEPLRNTLRERVLAEVPYSSCNSPVKDCLPNILNMSFQAAEGESIQLYLDAEGIIVSTSSACAAGDGKPSHVLMATVGDAEVAHSSIRFSLGLETTQADIDRILAVLPGIVERLQSISTVKVRK